MNETAPPRVLIADDDDAFRGCVFRHLQKSGDFECLTADSGGDALLQCARRGPDALLLDLRLRDINGFDVLRAVRSDRRTRRMPVVLVSGAGRADLLESAGRCAGAFAFLRKPVDMDEIAATLRAAVAVERGVDRDDDTAVVRGPIHLDLIKRAAFLDGVPLPMGPKRFDLLCALARARDGVPERVLRAMVWGAESSTPNIVSQTVARLRSDLAQAGGRDMIRSVPGGYRLAP
jgi:DNA-binding response OmpR family regulator